MPKTIVIIGCLDTKGEEFTYLKDIIEEQGFKTLIVDAGTHGEPKLKPDISNREVAKAVGADIDKIVKMGRGEAMDIMSKASAKVISRLYEEGRLDGIIGMGGSGGTAVATSGMKALPVGVPKVMVSTVAAGNVVPYIGTKDIVMIPSVVDVAGLNRISRQIFANAAGAITGMLRTESKKMPDEKPIISATMFGNTTPCVDHARGSLRKLAMRCWFSIAQAQAVGQWRI